MTLLTMVNFSQFCCLSFHQVSIKLKRECPYSCVDWDGLRHDLSDAPWGNIFKIGASTAGG